MTVDTVEPITLMAVPMASLAAVPANRKPIAVTDTYRTVEDTALTVAGRGVLRNDIDNDGDTLTAAVVNGPKHTTVALDRRARSLSTPNQNYSGQDRSPTRLLTTATSKAAKVLINVTAVNDAPAANPDTYTTAKNTKLTVKPKLGALANDTDPDSKNLTAQLVSGPATAQLPSNPMVRLPTPRTATTRAPTPSPITPKTAGRARPTTVSISVGTAEREVTATSKAADSESGEATITVAVRHAGDDPMTVNVTQPLGGSGTVGPVSAPIYDSATDTYTYSAAYTPHPQARLDAYSTDNPDKDQVTVTASDSHGASTEITVDVEISPARAVILDEPYKALRRGC